MGTVKDLIALAEAEVGYLEKKSDAQLDDKIANAGDKNFTKYSRDLVNLIGSPYAQGVSWCDIFIDYLMIKTFGKDKAKELLGGWSAYTPTSAQYYKDMKRWYTLNPQVGDQIFFKNSTRICHTGLVYKVDANKVYTIEGNTSSASGVVANGGAVAKKSYPLNYAKIAGYGRPNYPADTTPTGVQKTDTTFKPLSYPCRGVDVAAWQTNLDYAKMKADGVKFAILKVIRKDGNPDERFEEHYKGFTSAGVPVIAVYNYTYARTVEKARIDAQAVIKILAGRKIPVCLDVEDKKISDLGERLIDIINAYQNVVEAAGLPFIVYTGLSFFNSNLNPYISKLQCKNYWIARYYNAYTEMALNDVVNEKYKPNVPNLIGWQYTSSGKVNGSKSRLDCNILYRAVDVSKASITTSKRGVVATNSLRVREQPNTSSNTLGYLKKGEIITITRTDSATGWYNIGNGWVSNKYITLL